MRGLNEDHCYCYILPLLYLTGGGGGGDLTAPVISNCPANIQQNLPNGQFAAVSWTAPTAVDESGDVTVVGPGVPSAFFAIGVTTISYIFTDAAGNEAICSFDIIITGKHFRISSIAFYFSQRFSNTDMTTVLTL